MYVDLPALLHYHKHVSTTTVLYTFSLDLSLVGQSVCLFVCPQARPSLHISLFRSLDSLSISLSFSLSLIFSISLSLPLSLPYLLSISLSLSLSFSLSFALCLRQSLCAYVTYTNHRHFDTIRIIIIILTTSSYPLKVRWILS